MEESPDVVRMVPDAEMALDDLGNAPGGPEVRAVPLREGALEQEADELATLAGRELRGSAGRGAHLEPSLAAAPHGVAPPHHGAGSAAQAAGDRVEGEALGEQRECLAATSFQHGGRAW